MAGISPWTSFKSPNNGKIWDSPTRSSHKSTRSTSYLIQHASSYMEQKWDRWTKYVYFNSQCHRSSVCNMDVERLTSVLLSVKTSVRSPTFPCQIIAGVVVVKWYVLKLHTWSSNWFCSSLPFLEEISTHMSRRCFWEMCNIRRVTLFQSRADRGHLERNRGVPTRPSLIKKNAPPSLPI